MSWGTSKWGDSLGLSGRPTVITRALKGGSRWFREKQGNNGQNIMILLFLLRATSSKVQKLLLAFRSYSWRGQGPYRMLGFGPCYFVQGSMPTILTIWPLVMIFKDGCRRMSLSDVERVRKKEFLGEHSAANTLILDCRFHFRLLEIIKVLFLCNYFGGKNPRLFCLGFSATSLRSIWKFILCCCGVHIWLFLEHFMWLSYHGTCLCWVALT